MCIVPLNHWKSHFDHLHILVHSPLLSSKPATGVLFLGRGCSYRAGDEGLVLVCPKELMLDGSFHNFRLLRTFLVAGHHSGLHLACTACLILIKNEHIPFNALHLIFHLRASSLKTAVLSLGRKQRLSTHHLMF